MLPLWAVLTIAFAAAASLLAAWMVWPVPYDIRLPDRPHRS